MIAASRRRSRDVGVELAGLDVVRARARPASSLIEGLRDFEAPFRVVLGALFAEEARRFRPERAVDQARLRVR
jgi:hypothetical protein